MRLDAELIDILHGLTELTSTQLAAFRAKDQDSFGRIDKQRVKAVIVKEERCRSSA